MSSSSRGLLRFVSFTLSVGVEQMILLFLSFCTDWLNCSGDVVVHNEADSEFGKALIKAAKARGYMTINILPNKSCVNESIEFLKSIGGDVVVTEAYANTWYDLKAYSASFDYNPPGRI